MPRRRNSVDGRLAEGLMTTIEQQESLWREHRDGLFRFVVSRVSDASAAEDIVHDVLVRAYQNRGTLRDDQKLEPWLYQITRNAVIDYYRARKPTTSLPDNLPEPDSEDGRGARTELSRCIQPFIRALPERYRRAVDLSEIRGLTQRETADVLGLTLSGAKSRVQRARSMLADMMLQCCKVEFDSRGAIMSYESRGCGSDGQIGGGCAQC
jgi:RNA polymerase sigma-70 factor, ECF subfamily